MFGKLDIHKFYFEKINSGVILSFPNKQVPVQQVDTRLGDPLFLRKKKTGKVTEKMDMAVDGKDNHEELRTVRTGGIPVTAGKVLTHPWPCLPVLPEQTAFLPHSLFVISKQ